LGDLKARASSTVAFAAGVDLVKSLALSVHNVWPRTIAASQEMYAL
jgi:hypothetical protein